ncbi:MOSC domain-containing protein [Serinicoccus kebangsaanensis]|uniref:MOSC domain-containing protein n=1 Tax=Serinicoccus kebangsaanensis TaxID=2602069 RepID=UPI00124E4FA4|nr:MOSC domain-containing protein [Serinicoccus kebangsaanensis]
MTPRIRSTNLARPKPDPGTPRTTGIDKHPVDGIDVTAPGPEHGDGSGAAGDLVGDSRHHGGADKALYAFAREELDRWGSELGRELRDGTFGENLTTAGIDLDGLELGQRLRVGSSLLEVSVPRQPCATFARHMGVDRWVRRFTEHGACGSYLRVVEPGRVEPGDTIVPGAAPGHGVSMRTAFAAAMGDDAAAADVVRAGCLPARYHDALVRRLAARVG